MIVSFWGSAMSAKRNGHLARGERLQIMLAPEELAVVDDFRFQHRMPSRAAAVRELFKLGLANVRSSPAVSGQKSTDFGVLGASTAKSREAPK
jgi:hypothetical protein